MLSTLLLLAVTQVPVNLGTDDTYSRIGMPLYGHLQSISSSGAMFRISSTVDTTLAGRSMLFPFGTAVRIHCAEDTYGAFVQDIGATIDTTTGLVTDAGSTSGRTSGPNGFFLPADQTLEFISPYPQRDDGIAVGMVSQRTKSCGDSASTSEDKLINGYPCDTAANDCTADANMTCSEANGPILGNYLHLDALSTTGNCYVEVLR